MVYIYDILLNFNDDLIEYFEWDDSDDIKYVKKIVLFKTNSKIIRDIIQNEVLFDSSFTNIIPKYDMNDLKDAGSVCLLTDGLMVIGVLIRGNQPVLISRLLLDEELEVLEVSEGIKETNIDYKIIKPKDFERIFLTRKESNIRKKLGDEIDNLYNSRFSEKLIYLYYEFTNKESQNIDYVYKYLKDSLRNFDDKHMRLFDILLLSNAKLD